MEGFVERGFVSRAYRDVHFPQLSSATLQAARRERARYARRGLKSRAAHCAEGRLRVARLYNAPLHESPSPPKQKRDPKVPPELRFDFHRFFRGAFAGVVVEMLLADANRLRRHFDQLVLINPFEALLERHRTGRF